MTDTQIITIAIAVVFPIVALIYSQVATKDRFGDFTKSMDNRFGDLIKSMDNRFDAMNKSMDNRFDALEKHVDEKIDNAFAHMELMLKLHESEHHKQ